MSDEHIVGNDEDTAEWYIPLMKDSAIALMKQGMWSETNAYSGDGKMREFITVSADQIHAQNLTTDVDTGQPFGKPQQVTPWGAILHSGTQFEIPLQVLEEAAGASIDEAAPGARPQYRATGARPQAPIPPAEYPEPPVAEKPMTVEQAGRVKSLGLQMTTNELFDHDKSKPARYAKIMLLSTDAVRSIGLAEDAKTGKLFDKTLQVTSWGGWKRNEHQYAVPVKTLETALKTSAGIMPKGDIKPRGISPDELKGPRGDIPME